MEYWYTVVMGFGLYTLDSILQQIESLLFMTAFGE